MILLTYINFVVYYVYLIFNRVRCHKNKNYNKQMFEKLNQKIFDDFKNKNKNKIVIEIKSFLKFRENLNHNEFNM